MLFHHLQSSLQTIPPQVASSVTKWNCAAEYIRKQYYQYPNSDSNNIKIYKVWSQTHFRSTTKAKRQGERNDTISACICKNTPALEVQFYQAQETLKDVSFFNSVCIGRWCRLPQTKAFPQFVHEGTRVGWFALWSQPGEDSTRPLIPGQQRAPLVSSQESEKCRESRSGAVRADKRRQKSLV